MQYKGADDMNESFCEICGGEMKEWNMNIYECDDCGNMVDASIYEED